MPSLKVLWRSTTLRTGVVYGAAGLGFAGANLLLARALPVEEYGLFALAVAFLNLCIPVAPLGLDGMVNRHFMSPDGGLIRRAILTSALVAGVAAVVAIRSYPIPPRFAILVAVAILAGGVNYVAAAFLQSRRRFGLSLALVQGANLVMVAAAVVALVVGSERALIPFAVLVGYYVVAAVTGWAIIVPGQRAAGGAGARIHWGESLAYVGVSAVIILLGQLERLLVPGLLGLPALALFGVVAATVGSVFRILLLGVGYSLLPTLRAAPDVAARRTLVSKEARATVVLLVASSPIIWWGAPWLVEWLLAGRYALPPALVLAAMVTGYIRVGGAFARTIVSAVGSRRQLAGLNLLGWLAAAVATVAAVIGARWGLVGVIYGVGAGWLTQATTALWLAAPHLGFANRGSGVPARHRDSVVAGGAPDVDR